VSLHYLVKRKVTAECLLRTQTTYSQSVVVSVGVSRLQGVTDLIFVDPEAKVNGAYYLDVCSCHSSCCQ